MTMTLFRVILLRFTSRQLIALDFLNFDLPLSANKSVPWKSRNASHKCSDPEENYYVGRTF